MPGDGAVGARRAPNDALREARRGVRVLGIGKGAGRVGTGKRTQEGRPRMPTEVRAILCHIDEIRRRIEANQQRSEKRATVLNALLREYGQQEANRVRAAVLSG